MKELVIIGNEETLKTTIANALLGWDILPQSSDDIFIPTRENASSMLTDEIRLTDTPGYDYLWNTIPDETVRAVSMADTLVVMLSELWEEDDIRILTADPDWKQDRAAEEALLRKLLAHGKNRDIFFVIPYDTRETQADAPCLRNAHKLAIKRFASMSDRGESGFFCVDPRQALIATIEDDHTALEQSGILPLKTALMGKEK